MTELTKGLMQTLANILGKFSSLLGSTSTPTPTQTLANMLGSTTTPTPTNYFEDNEMFMIIIIVLLILCSSSSVSVLLLV